MAARNDIEIGFDGEDGEHYAIWRPPVVLGLGKSVAEALRDMREAVELCMECHVQRVLKETAKEV